MLENLQVMQELVTSFNLLILQFGKEIELQKIIGRLVTAGIPRELFCKLEDIKDEDGNTAIKIISCYNVLKH